MNNFDKELVLKYVPQDEQLKAFKLLEEGYPVQYIIGNVDFYDCRINVSKDVLIPRFETEYLVDDIIKYIKKEKIISPKILDIGTGSGCISIAIKKHTDGVITAIDKSDKAISIAKKNAKENNVNISFICEDLEKFSSNDKYDIIISNPPYVPYNEKVDEKTRYEPKDAIFAPEDGLYFYKVIFEKFQQNLRDKYLLAFEIGHNQGDKLVQIAKEYYPTAIITYKKDLNGFDRYLYIKSE